MPLIALLIALASVGSAQDWSQFRGPGGLAVADGTPLPETFDPSSSGDQSAAGNPGSAGLAWRAELRGSGISSPIVSRERVFVTSSYEGEVRSRIQRWTHLAIVVALSLALLALAKGLRARRSRPADVAPVRGWRTVVLRFDRALVVAATIGFLALAVLVIVAPHRFWTAGIPGDAWLVTSTVALVGLFGALGWFGPASRGRLVAVIVLLVAGALALHYLPRNKHHSVYKIEYRAVLVAPAVLGALWYLLAFVSLAKNGRRELGRVGALMMVSVLSLGTVMFVAANFLNPRVGLVRSVTCLDFKTGEQLWQTPLFVAPEERLHRQNSFATPTVCADGERMLAFFGPGYACLDYDGKVLWEGRDEQFYDSSHYGCVSSPIEFEDTFIVLQATENPDRQQPYMMALDKRTGQVRWRISPERAHDCYMTPMLMDVAGQTQLIAVHFACAVGYDPRTGQQLWEQELSTWQHAPSLTQFEGVLLVSGGAHEKWVTAGVQLEASEGGTKPTVLWQSTRAVPDSSSPVVHNGLLFTASAAGIMVCYDPKSGEIHWRERVDGTIRASLVAGDGKIFASTEEGELVTVAADKEFKVLGRSSIGETLLATPAIQAGHVLVRGERYLYCFRPKAQ